MLVSALLKSSATDRASCRAQSSFCLWARWESAPAGAAAEAATGGAGSGSEGGSCCRNGDFGSRRHPDREQLQQKNILPCSVAHVCTQYSAGNPLFSRNFSGTASTVGGKLRNCAHGLRLFASQMASNWVPSRSTPAPNARTPARLARSTRPSLFTSKTGHSASCNGNSGVAGLWRWRHGRLRVRRRGFDLALVREELQKNPLRRRSKRALDSKRRSRFVSLGKLKGGSRGRGIRL